MHIDVLTLFPEVFAGPLQASIFDGAWSAVTRDETAQGIA
jgi:tRNA G37 N-methylase TrmD